MKHKDEIIEMALSDKVPFDTIKQLYGLDENQVKRLMKAELKPRSYRAWRKRVKRFTKQRSFYKCAGVAITGLRARPGTVH